MHNEVKNSDARLMARIVLQYAQDKGLVPLGVTSTKKAFEAVGKYICSQKTS